MRETAPLDAGLRRRFDRLLDRVIAELPPPLRAKLEEVPLVVDDWPDPEVLRRLRVPDPGLLCGLYTGIPLTRRSVRQSGTLPDVIRLFRAGVIARTGGRGGQLRDDRLREQIRRTLLHEIGHHFGMDEGDLAELGYG